jgi:hypothetical protein
MNDDLNYLIHVCELYLQGSRVIVVGCTTGSHTGQSRAEEIRETLLWEAEIEGDCVKRWQIHEDRPDVRARLGAEPGSLPTFSPGGEARPPP